MRLAWRIVKGRLTSTAFDGEGARLFGGRWNSRGTRVFYTSATQSLEALEILVHPNPPVRFQFAVIGIAFDDALVETLTDLPSKWRQEAPSRATQRDRRPLGS